MLLLDRQALDQVLSMDAVIEAVERGFARYHEARGQSPVRLNMAAADGRGTFLVMPAIMAQPACFGTKIISVFPGNPRQGKATLGSAYLLNSAVDGAVLALMDGLMLTGMRTGAASAVASKYLARPDAKVLGIIGTGAQALYQAMAICAVRPIETVLAFDVDGQRLDSFCRRAGERLRRPVRARTAAALTACDCDILVTTTTATSPVVDIEDVRPGCHINAVGAFTPQMQEIGAGLIQNALVVVDTYDGALEESGDLIVPIEAGIYSKARIHADLAQIVVGQKQGRRDPEQITLFESVGASFEDLVTGELAYRRACEVGAGLNFDLH